MSRRRNSTLSTASEVTVTVKLFATLRDLAPEGADPRGFTVSMSPGATLGALATHLGLPEALWRVAFRNNVVCRDPQLPLTNGDTIAFFPPIAGG